jgi:hypothetical protein
MCSGSFSRSSIPASVTEERMPDIKMLAIKLARIMKSRLLPVFNAARATRMIPTT